MTVSHWQADGSQVRHDVDVLVVGAGVVGCAAAYFATQAGREVVITEMRDVGMGASGRNAGFMITGIDMYYHHAIARYGHSTVRELYALSKTTHGHWRHFAETGGVKLDECGSMLLAESPEEAEELKIAAEAMHKDGIAVIYHDHDPLDRGYFAAIEQPWDCAVQPYDLAMAICEQSGAELIANNELYRLEQNTNGGVTVYTQHVIFNANKVMLCTNAYSPRIHPYFIGKVIPTRAQCLVTETLDTPVLNTCGYSDYGYMYYRSTFDNRLLIGGGRKQHQKLENNTTEDRVTDPVQTTLDVYMQRHFPEVKVPVSRRWSGIMGFTQDKIPLVGTLPDMPDVGFVVGFTGHGLAFGAGTAARAMAHLLNGEDAGVVSISRFE